MNKLLSKLLIFTDPDIVMSNMHVYVVIHLCDSM